MADGERQIATMPAPDTLGRLPPELLDMVFDRLLPRDIKLLRLINKKYCRLSSSRLMKRAFFALRPNTLAAFNKVVDHPVFSLSVKHIVYDATQFTDQRQRQHGGY